MAAVTYAYYSNTYGGGLSEPAFGDCLPIAEAHVKWLCANRCYCPTSTAFKRAVCAAVDTFAEYGAGEVGGYTIGEFSVKNYASQESRGAFYQASDLIAVLEEASSLEGIRRIAAR